MKFDLWDKITVWQKRLVVIASIIASVSFLYPKYTSLMDEINQVIEFQKQSRQIEKDLENLNGYIQVLGGILRSTLIAVDDRNYGTVIVENGKNRLVEVKLRKTKNNDIFVFVPDGMIGIYSVAYNNDEGKYSYISFMGNYHLIYEVDIASTIDK